MSLKIKVSNMVGFTVEGTINDADGKAQDFNFGLTAKRLDESALAQAQKDLGLAVAQDGLHDPIANKLCEIITNWSDVRDEDDSPLAFSQDGLRALLNSHNGLSLILWRRYQRDCGAREKN